ncbi:MAG: response regulator transcription factor [Bacillota bacterium]
MDQYQIMVVEDDRRTAELVRGYLQRYGYRVDLVNDFGQVEQEFLARRPQLVILDVNLPYQDGFHLCRALRRHSAVPILFLSARAGDMEQVLGLESGGDDYLTKPFHLEVLHAKVKAILRRAYGEYAVPQASARSMIQLGELQLDLAAGEVRFGGQAQQLTKNELRLLALLIETAPATASRERCLETLWDDASFVDDNTLTVNVTRLRHKLATWGLDEAIVTRRGLGYQLVPERLGRR